MEAFRRSQNKMIASRRRCRWMQNCMFKPVSGTVGDASKHVRSSSSAARHFLPWRNLVLYGVRSPVYLLGYVGSRAARSKSTLQTSDSSKLIALFGNFQVCSDSPSNASTFLVRETLINYEGMSHFTSWLGEELFDLLTCTGTEK